MVEYSRDSSFNMGIAHLTRIDNLLSLVAEASLREDYPSWFKALATLSKEVFFLFEQPEYDKCVELENNCATSMTNFYSTKSIESKKEAYNNLTKYEYFIKKQLADRKMLMAFSRDIKSAISDLM